MHGQLAETVGLSHAIWPCIKASDGLVQFPVIMKECEEFQHTGANGFPGNSLSINDRMIPFMEWMCPLE